MKSARNTLTKLLVLPVMLGMLAANTLVPTAEAHDRSYNRYYDSRYNSNWGTFGQRHPYVKKAAIGGGAGALIGGVLAPDGYRGDGAIKGAVIGAGAGLGYEYLRRQGTFGNNRFRW
ncbi:hypothetical protein [Vampirovibrio chlorellavorus]|uniref:hypothetical protein n=1 Tax=Vampirovibrio chlorellavorus TaxID=758823 RepID=UPI0026EEE468|nr:hypothetical protein [Vampirovibrio chlorellavorus]